MTTTANKKTQGVIPYLPEEVDYLEGEIQRFQNGTLPELEFVGFRLKQGVYGQRQLGVNMIRVKIPFGGLTADQLDALGVICDRFAPLRKGHLTTRENVQVHHIPLADTPEALRILGDSGLTSREACGNTVRNVVACPHAGVSTVEAFDPTPYVGAYARYFVRHPITQLMPRKLKTAFSCGENDCAMTAIHDMGLIARIREVDGVKRKGFKIVVGGGTSIMPRLAPTLYEFVPVEDYLRVVEACLRIFNKADELRKNRMRARIKFLVDRVGIDAFRTMVEKELAEPWAKKNIDPSPYLFIDDESEDAPLLASPPLSIPMERVAPSQARGEVHGPLGPKFVLWMSTNVKPQKQTGYRMVYITVPHGDLSPEQYHGIADITRRHAGGRARVTQEQDLLLRWVPEDHVAAVYAELQALGLDDPGFNEITDVVTCPGTDSCKLGITSSMGAGTALRQTLVDMKIDDPETRKMHVKVSGCPNGCGQHHIAQIGFHGAAMKGAGGQQLPAYEVFIGGNADADRGPIRFGARVAGRVPAKRVSEFVEKSLALYTSQRTDASESFNAFIDRVGTKPFEPILSAMKDIGPLNRETIHLYMDWEKTIPYRLERGEGECAM